MTVEMNGRKIKVHLVIGEDVQSGEALIANAEEFTPRDICQFFVAIAAINRVSIEEMARLLVRGAKHLQEEDAELMKKVKVIR